ncbi:hypothetical protein [Roseovarius pacificus]|uniref:hypothetical protein n=1 Tax=Roseovarius pacificus TaxID=337701 RepID=UPI002A18BCF0|nr:hypothetical protein [Roseovarius pacificus]
MTYIIKTTAVFLHPFELASFNEIIPAGEYEIETELFDSANGIEPTSWTSSVLVHLNPRASHPGLARTLTVPLAELERAIVQDKLTGKALTDYFLEEMLTDPMICLVMRADGVSEEEVRDLYSGRARKDTCGDEVTPEAVILTEVERLERMSPRPMSSRPGIGE